MLRLRAALRDYFPAYQPLGLTSTTVLRLLAKASTPAAAAKLTTSQICAALKGRRTIADKAVAIRRVLRAKHLGQPEVVSAAYGATVRATIAVLQTLNTRIKTLEGEVEAHFGRHPDADVCLSQSGLGAILGARVLAELGDAHARRARPAVRRRPSRRGVVHARDQHRAHGRHGHRAPQRRPKATAYGVHLATALVMLATSALLFRA